MFSELHSATNDAFSDYVVPMCLSAQQFEMMMRQRSLDLLTSSIAIADGQIAAFWLIGLRGSNSYLIASGTRPRFRRQGLSRRIAGHAFDLARARGATSMSAEVISTNDKAVALYRGLGFETRRTLVCYTVRPDERTGQARHALEAVNWQDVRPVADQFWDFPPSWQNESPSLDALGSDMKCFTARIDGRDAGYLALSSHSNTICQLAVDSGYRRRGVASDLLHAAYRQAGTDLRLLNIDARDQDLARFLAVHNAQKTVEQFELSIQL